MSKYKVDSESLTAVADAIRAKTGNDEPLEFPDEFVSEIGNISGGDPLFHEKVGDGNTYLYIYLPTENHLDVTLYASMQSNSSFSIDWGDGSAVETYSTGSSFNHTYPEPGYYCVKLVKVSGTPYVGTYSGNSWIFGGGSYPGRLKQAILIGAEVGGDWHASVNELFYGSGCTFLYTEDAIPNSNGTSTPEARECRLLNTLEISKHATSIKTYSFTNCFNLREVTIPDNIESLGANAFGYVGAKFHMKSTTPPTLSSTTAFSASCNPTFYVPYSADHSVLDAYKTATNWSTFASQIFEEPEE